MKTFSNDIKSKIKYADIEKNKFLQTHQIIYLQQACGKLFSAVENYMMVKYDKRVRSFQNILILASNNKKDSLLLTQAAQLHYFYYNGELQMSSKEALILYNDVLNKLKNRVR